MIDRYLFGLSLNKGTARLTSSKRRRWTICVCLCCAKFEPSIQQQGWSPQDNSKDDGQCLTQPTSGKTKTTMDSRTPFARTPSGFVGFSSILPFWGGLERPFRACCESRVGSSGHFEPSAVPWRAGAAISNQLWLSAKLDAASNGISRRKPKQAKVLEHPKPQIQRRP